jgi:hypothetical protein
MDPIPLRRRSRPTSSALFTGATLLFLSCNTTPIKELLDDPARFDGKTVRIAGEVKNSAGILGYGAYQIDDGTGSLAVVSQGGGAPREGATVGVEGTFRSAFTLGTQSIAVIMEKKRASP